MQHDSKAVGGQLLQERSVLDPRFLAAVDGVMKDGDPQLLWNGWPELGQRLPQRLRMNAGAVLVLVVDLPGGVEPQDQKPGD
jgi:hypothetical protein